MTEHTRHDHALALVAAAYEDAAALVPKSFTGADRCGPETAQNLNSAARSSIRSRTPTDAQAALEAYRKRVREEALREAYQNLRTYAPHEDFTTGPEHDIGYAVGYRTAMNRIRALIEGDTHE